MTSGSTERAEGRGLIRLAWIGTAITCVTSIVNAITGSRDAYALSAVPALVMLVLGSVAFLWAFAVAVQRSRAEAIGIGGLFFLSGCAPRRVQVEMMVALALQSVVPVVVATIRPFTAFAVLAPMWTLGLMGLWGARHGTFPPRAGLAASPPTGRGASTGADAPD